MKSYTFPVVLLIIALTASLTANIANQTQNPAPASSVISLSSSHPLA